MARWRRSESQVQDDIAAQSKVCCVCEERKPFDEFYNLKNKSDGKSYRCKVCDGIAREKHRKKNKEKVQGLSRIQNLQNKYGLRESEYQAMMDDQRGCCKICGESLINPDGPKQQMCVDHDHNTGKVRGLLCTNCNSLLGQAKDSIDNLKRAIKYLKENT